MASELSVRAMRMLGVVTAIGVVACDRNEQTCEGQRTFDPLPEPDPGPNAAPTVLSGEWISGDVLELTFSEPLSPTTAPDPRRFVLVNWSATVTEYYGSDTCRQQTNYRQFGAVNYYYYYSQPTSPVADIWVAPENSSLLRLRIASSGATCRPQFGEVEAGLMLVYTNADGEAELSKLIDASDDSVPSFGPSWAVSNWSMCSLQATQSNCSYNVSNYYQGHLPLLDTLAPIPCPGT